MVTKKIELRKHLNADSLISLIRSSFEEIEDHRSKNTTISLSDALISAFAMFFLKDILLYSLLKREYLKISI
jgi:hypothetical protein